MSVKLKGIFQSGPIDVEHNPHGNIITDAVVNYFQTGKPIEDYIQHHERIEDFLFVRKVTGGATFEGKPVGKVVRFYYSNTSKEALRYEKNGNLVPKSTNCRPLMDIPKALPMDLDTDRYQNESEALLETLNQPCKTGRNKRIADYSKMGLNLVPWPWKGLTTVKAGYDFSAINRVGIQTGFRANTLAIEYNDAMTLNMGNWSFYQFDDKRFPGAMKTVSKKIGFNVAYGGAIELTDNVSGVMRPLPDILYNNIFNSMGLAQRRKVVDGQEFLL